MIWVHRLNGDRFIVNDDHIEFIEETPDTVISLQSGRKVVVREGADELIERIAAFRRRSWERGGRDWLLRDGNDQE